MYNELEQAIKQVQIASGRLLVEAFDSIREMVDMLEEEPTARNYYEILGALGILHDTRIASCCAYQYWRNRADGIMAEAGYEFDEDGEVKI